MDRMENMVERAGAECTPLPGRRPNATQAQDLQALTSSFMIAASHELRGPLACVSAGLELLMSSDCARTRENQRICLETMRDGVDRLTHVTQRLLEASSATLGHVQLRLKPVNLADLLTELKPALAAMLRSRQQKLTLVTATGLPTVRADGKHIAAIVRDLVENASLYSASGAKIRIRSTPGDTGMVRLQVQDQGIGIPPEEASNVFTPFFRGAAARRMTPHGLGLSLAAARALVRQHGGRIWFKSVPGRGSTFSLELPIYEYDEESNDQDETN